MSEPRFHDGSAYEAGFEAGYNLPIHAAPLDVPPAYAHAARSSTRWRLGYRAGIEARDERLRIAQQKSRREQVRLARGDRKRDAYDDSTDHNA